MDECARRGTVCTGEEIEGKRTRRERSRDTLAEIRASESALHACPRANRSAPCHACGKEGTRAAEGMGGRRERRGGRGTGWTPGDRHGSAIKGQSKRRRLLCLLGDSDDG